VDILVLNQALSLSKSTFAVSRADGAFIDLPKSFSFETPDISRRISVGDKLRQDGGIVTGDGTYQERRLQMRYSFASSTDATYRENMNTLEAFFRKNQRPYYLTDKANEIRAEVILTKHGIKESAGGRNRAAINSTLDLVMVDGLWEDQYETIWPDGSTGGGGTLPSGEVETMVDGGTANINVSGKFDVFPVIEFTAVGNVISFIFENTTLSGGFEFESNDFLSGTTLIFSSIDGTIYLDGVESSAYLTRGGPIILQPGDNTLSYESAGGDVQVQISYRNRYAF